jgi:hypothetical protein
MKKNRIKYKHSIVSFFDILGFRKLIQNSSAETIYKILEIFKNQSKHDDEVASLFKMKFTNFSDCVVRSVDFIGNEAEYPIKILFSELIDLVHIQCSLIYENILIRGAISVDEIYHSNQTVFGPGLVKAYLMENFDAKYPRIILKKNLIDSLSKIFKTESEQDDIKQILSLLRSEQNNFYYLDYLRVISNEADHHTDFVRFLDHHKNLIVENYSLATKPRVIDKYVWLAEYHNDVVYFMEKGLKDFGWDVQKLIIPKSVVRNKGLLHQGNDDWRLYT